ncbi:hypothetical protein Vi05172_g2643 [Venturia inaequalis]|nr:hypothetical protein Vi05172_g2643 [Venturia inaequalis]
MSSFINKSGKKVAPKGAPRRRAGGPPAATPAVPQPSVQPSIEKPQEALQAGETAIPASNAPAQLPTPNATPTEKPPTPSAPAAQLSTPNATQIEELPTPNATQIEKPPTPSAPAVTTSLQPPEPPDIESDPAPNIQTSSVQQSGPQVSHEISLPKEPIATIAPEVPRAIATITLPTVTTTSTVRRRSASPLVAEDGSRPAKRPRVEEVVDTVQASTAPTEVIGGNLRPPAPMIPSPNLPEIVRKSVILPALEPIVSEHRERIEVESVPRVENGLPAIHNSSRPRQPDSPSTERLVSNTPPAGSSQADQFSKNKPPSKTAQPAEQNATAASSAPPIPRAKRARKDQWQVSTPTDVTSGVGKRKSRKPADRMQIEAPQEAENVDELNQPSVVTLTPATSGADAAPKTRKVRKDKGVKKTSKTSTTETSTQSAEAPGGEVSGETASSETPAAELASGDQNDAQPLSAAAQKRLANAQKRKAKQLAKTGALSKAAGRANAATIDKAVAQSIEGRSGSSSRASAGPTFIATPGIDREGTAATGRSSVAVTDGGSVKRRGRRQKRAETPEENESVFIVESKTSMFDLAGRDTENRVGAKSEREKAMRLIDWEEVKKKRKAENERMARMARGKRNQDEDYDPEEEGMDEDEILARRVARNKNKRPALQITLMANGEHGIDEQSQMVDRHRLNEDELELLEEVEEDDLTKKFNVQTYGLWRRKEEDERIPHNERWTFDQTDKFYDALTSFGTDFMIISTMFPGMTRRQIKAKFVREERQEPERIRDALTGHNSGRRNGVEGSGWDLKVYCEGAGLSESAFLDPKKIHEELERERLEKEKEIEEARAEAAEEERQRKLAGALNGDDELGSDGEPLSPGAVVKRAKEMARQKKLARLGEKKRKIMEMAGGSEEVVESIED